MFICIGKEFYKNGAYCRFLRFQELKQITSLLLRKLAILSTNEEVYEWHLYQPPYGFNE